MYYNINATEGVNEVLKYASTLAKKYNSGEIATEHLLYGLCKFKDSKSSQVLSECGVTSDKLEVLLAQNGESLFGIDSVDLSPSSKQVFRVASEVALELKHTFVGTEHLLLGLLLSENSVAVNLLEEVFSCNITSLREKVLNILKGDNLANTENENSVTSKLPKNLLEMGTDLTLKAREGKIDPIIGRNEEIERLIEILCRKTKNNPVLIGEAGVGKSAIVEGLALRIVKGDVPQELQDKTIFSLELGGLMAGTKYRGALEEKLKDVIETITKNKNIITFIDEIHTLSQAGSEKGEISPSDMLKPYLARGELQTIGATTTDEYRKFIEKDKALERRFQPIIVSPPSIEDAILILKGVRDSYEAYHKVKITDEALESAVKLSDRYITDRNLPDKAIDLIDEASSRAKVNISSMPKEVLDKERELTSLENTKKEALLQENFEKAAKLRDEIKSLSDEIAKIKKENFDGKEYKEITSEDIAEVVSKWTNIPVSKLNMQEKERLVNLEKILHERIVGQNEAVDAVSKAIRRARVGLKDSKRPIGSFIFLGQTGVGKTELCKALAEAMFNSENAIIRLDMSEYMESHSVSKLIGSPPGYVGHEDGGYLTEQVRRKPYSVILFDEIEKAHPDIFNILLQILEDGRLTDSHGKTVSFQNTIIIMTSNCGVSELQNEQRSLGFNAGTNKMSEEQENEILKNSLKKHFKPEFLNRIDVITVFHPLSKVELTQIASIMINNLNKKLKEQNLSIKLTENAVDYLITNGSNNMYGARPLRRLIEQKIEDRIAEDLLQEKIHSGNSIIVDSENNELVFTYKD
ncbi:MAG: ATP-dependent Clp protease ATP-binding subunit [Christensenellales bacterium]